MAKKDQHEETIVDVQEVYTKTEMFIDRNRKQLSTVISVVAVLIIGYYAYQNLVVAPNNQEANESIWKAEQYFEMDSLDLALTGDGIYLGFEDVAAEYEGTPAASRANYLMGVIYRDRGEFETALDYFKNADFDDEIVGVMAVGSVGDMYAETGDLEEAVSWYGKAVSKAKESTSENYSAPTYLLKKGIVQMELGENSSARKTFAEISAKYPEFRDISRAKKLEASLANQ